MKIERATTFTPIIITIETEEEARALAEDINLAESFMINEVTPRTRTKLNDISRQISDLIDGIVSL